MKKWIEDHKKTIIIWIVIIAILLAGPVIIYTGKSIFKWAWNNYQWSVGYNKPVPTPTPVPVPVLEPTIAPDPTPVSEPSESPSPTQPSKKKTVPKKEPVIAFSDKKIEQVHATSDGKSGHRQYRERTKDGRPDGVQFDGVFVKLKDCKTCYPPTKTKTTESKPDQKSTSTPKPPVISYKEGFEKPHTSGKGHREYSDKYVDGVFEKRVLLGTYLKNKDCALCFPHPKDIDPAPNYKPTPTPVPTPIVDSPSLTQNPIYTGVGGTKTLSFIVPQGTHLITNGYKVVGMGYDASVGVFKISNPGTYNNITIVDGVYQIVDDREIVKVFQGYLDQANVKNQADAVIDWSTVKH